VANAAAVEHSSTPRTAPLFDQDAVPSLFDQDAPSSSGRGDDGIRTFDASDTAPRRTPRSGRVISIVVAVALVAALAGAGYALASTLGGTRVVVPGLVGYSEAEARALAESADVDVRVERRESDDPEGVVIDQRPAAGERSSGSVTVIVSSGPPPIAAPELIGLGRKAATAAATDAGLVPEVVQAFDERAPVGRVIAQDPGVGEPAARDSTIRITVSQGPAPRPVPPVGADVDDARAALQEQGFTVGEVQEFSDTVDEGDVIETRPGSGTEAPFGSEVVLVVSKGPELVGVPNVFGQSLESACREIRGLGLECDVENFVEGGRVQNQEPQPGEKVERGTSVTIYL
jgi:serine/threonine-protein kinase